MPWATMPETETPPTATLPFTRLEISAFTIEVNSVTKTDFARFADATGYVTDAERVMDAAARHHTSMITRTGPGTFCARARLGGPCGLIREQHA